MIIFSNPYTKLQAGLEEDESYMRVAEILNGDILIYMQRGTFKVSVPGICIKSKEPLKVECGGTVLNISKWVLNSLVLTLVLSRRNYFFKFFFIYLINFKIIFCIYNTDNYFIAYF